jgi:ferrochelatase
MTHDAVLVIAYGAPDRPEDVRPYLAGILRGRRVPPGRIDEVAQHYMRFGGSPLTALTRRQASALERALRARGAALPVYVGMRNWTPYLHETLEAMRAAGVRRALGVIMAPHQSYASWDQYVENVADARARAGDGAPAVDYLEPWFAETGFVEAQADRVAAALASVPDGERDGAALVFTAHSIPAAMAACGPYAAQIATTARLVARQLGRTAWEVAYQSRSGDPREPWLEPDIGDALRALAARRVRTVVVAPVGFVADHIEVLYDLDTEARRIAGDLGLAFHRAGTVMDHPAFIRMLADLVAARERVANA